MNPANYRLRGRGVLFRLHGPNGSFHLGWSRSDNTLCGLASLSWPCDSASNKCAFCASCVKVAARQMPHLTFKTGANE